MQHKPSFFLKMWDAYKKLWAYSITFEGTSTRSDFWYAVLSNLLFSSILSVFMFYFKSALNFILTLQNIYSLAVFIPTLALIVRRFRDAGFSFWWVVGFYFINFIALFYFLALYSPNPTDIPTDTTFLSLWVFTLLYNIFVLVVLILPSKKNQTLED